MFLDSVWPVIFDMSMTPIPFRSGSGKITAQVYIISYTESMKPQENLRHSSWGSYTNHY